jgi:predicted PhzF superfamily epimerase YddE/YHI9
MSHLNLLKQGIYHQETKAGILEIEIQKDSFVQMAQSLPEFSDFVDKDEAADSLNIDPSQIPTGLLVQVVSTGLRDIFDTGKKH